MQAGAHSSYFPCTNRWSPDGLSVLLVADFRVRLTVWSLLERKATYLPGPKHYDKGMAFSPRRDQLAVLEVSSKNHLQLFSPRYQGWKRQPRYLHVV